MSQPTPQAGWYPDPSNAQQLRYWDGSTWTDHTQPNPQAAPPPPPAYVAPPPPPAYTAPPQAVGFPPQPPLGYAPAVRQFPVTNYNQRMAQRIAGRAKLDEPAVAVAFAFNNLATMLAFGLIEDVIRLVPTIGELLDLAISLVSFYFHRIVIVTDRSVYVYRDLPFHRPGERLAAFARGSGVVRIGPENPGGFSGMIRRGELRFQDGTVVYHSPIWIRRAQYVAQEGNIPAGQ